MYAEFRGRFALENEVILFSMMGQALINIQVLEECLSVSITLKKDVGYPRKVSKVEADKLLEKYRKFTLGQSINVASEHKLYNDDLQHALKTFQKERNWLVHKSMDDFYSPDKKEKLFMRIKSVATAAHKIQLKIEDDLINFAEISGLNMSNVRQEIKKWEQRIKIEIGT